MAATAVVASPIRSGHVGPYVRLQRDGNVATSSGEVCMSQTIAPRFKGVFPVVPTTFRDDGELDLDSQRRCLDFMIDVGSNGLCILANFSEQFVLSDEEREVLTDLTLEHVAGRVPVIVTTSHFSTRVCAQSAAGEHKRLGLPW